MKSAARVAEDQDAATTEFDIAELDAADTSQMTVMSNGKATKWVWTFAGPAHAKSVEQANRIARERLHIERMQEQSRVNNKKWKAAEESPEQALERNVTIVIERLLGWSDVSFNGTPFPFSPDNARQLLTDRRKGALLLQALEFLGDENAFTKRSATT